MEKEPVVTSSIGSSSDEKLPVEQIEKTSTIAPNEDIHIDPVISARVTQRFDKRVVPVSIISPLSDFDLNESY